MIAQIMHIVWHVLSDVIVNTKKLRNWSIIKFFYFSIKCDGCGSYIVKTHVHYEDCGVDSYLNKLTNLCLDCHEGQIFPEG